MPVRTLQADVARAPRHERLRLLGAHAQQARALAARGAHQQERRPQRRTATSRRGTAAAATSACYRKIDFRRDKLGIPARVAAIEYDPNRSAHIALLHYADGEKRYIIAPAGPRASATACSRATTPRSAPATRCRSRRSRSARCVHAIELQARQGRAARARGGHRRAADGARGTLRDAAHAERRAPPWSTCAAWRRSARSATPSTRTRRSARPAARAGRASARTCAASR